MSETTVAGKTFLQKLLDGVETVGNKVPHPAVIFLLMSAIVIVLSHVFHLLGSSVTYQVIDPTTHKAVETTAVVNSLLTVDGIRFIITSAIRNFLGFTPVGVILVAMVGVGLAEEAGLINALIRKIVIVAPRKAITFIIVAMGVLSSVASDAGYLVLIPLGRRRIPEPGQASARRTGGSVRRRRRRVRCQPDHHADRRRADRNHQRRDPPAQSVHLHLSDREPVFLHRVQHPAVRRLHRRHRTGDRTAAWPVPRRNGRPRKAQARPQGRREDCVSRCMGWSASSSSSRCSRCRRAPPCAIRRRAR